MVRIAARLHAAPAAGQHPGGGDQHQIEVEQGPMPAGLQPDQGRCEGARHGKQGQRLAVTVGDGQEPARDQGQQQARHLVVDEVVEAPGGQHRAIEGGRAGARGDRRRQDVRLRPVLARPPDPLAGAQHDKAQHRRGPDPHPWGEEAALGGIGDQQQATQRQRTATDPGQAVLRHPGGQREALIARFRRRTRLRRGPGRSGDLGRGRRAGGDLDRTWLGDRSHGFGFGGRGRSFTPQRLNVRRRLDGRLAQQAQHGELPGLLVQLPDQTVDAQVLP
jgi:hypothetical protein